MIKNKAIKITKLMSVRIEMKAKKMRKMQTKMPAQKIKRIICQIKIKIWLRTIITKAGLIITSQERFKIGTKSGSQKIPQILINLTFWKKNKTKLTSITAIMEMILIEN